MELLKRTRTKDKISYVASMVSLIVFASGMWISTASPIEVLLVYLSSMVIFIVSIGYRLHEEFRTYTPESEKSFISISVLYMTVFFIGGLLVYTQSPVLGKFIITGAAVMLVFAYFVETYHCFTAEDFRVSKS